MSTAKIPAHIQELLNIDGNDSCMECESRKVEWASINLGIFLCEECSGRHRSLGTHVSQVRSLWLDAWAKETVEFFRVNGNTKAKRFYEAKVPTFEVRPPNDKGTKVMEHWLRQKYERRKYVLPDIDSDDDKQTDENRYQNDNGRSTITSETTDTNDEKQQDNRTFSKGVII